MHRIAGLLGGLIALGSMTAIAAPTVYIQGSEINLRSKPNARAKLAKKVSIATACEHLADHPGGWVQLRCGRSEGFTKASLVGSERPTLENLSAKIKAATSAKERLNFALRAATLAPDRSEVLDQLKGAFLAAEFEALRKLRSEGKNKRDHYSFYCSSGSKTVCFRQKVGRGLGDWNYVQLSAPDYVGVVLSGGTLRVISGMIDRFEQWKKRLHVLVEFRIDYPRSPPLVLKALKRGSRKGKQEKLLSLKGLSILSELPKGPWAPLSGARDRRYIQTECFSQVQNIEVNTGVFGHAKIWFHQAQDSDEGTLVDVRRSGGVYRLDGVGYFSAPGRKRSIKIRRSKERNVLMIDGAPFGFGRDWEQRAPAEECGEP